MKISRQNLAMRVKIYTNQTKYIAWSCEQTRKQIVLFHQIKLPKPSTYYLSNTYLHIMSYSLSYK